MLNRAAWLAGTLVVVVVVLAIAWVLFVPTADWIATHDVGHVTGALRTVRLQAARDAARGRLLTFGAGVFAAGALVFTARSFSLSREGQVTDRYTKAIEQLGSKEPDVRFGGIYALERVARDSARDQQTVIEVLATFIREHSREQWPVPAPGVNITQHVMRPDIQAAITVIGRRDIIHDSMRVDLTGADLSDAFLVGANLGSLTAFYLQAFIVAAIRMALAPKKSRRAIYATIFGYEFRRTSLVGAKLTGANLTDAKLLSADLSGADLTKAKLIVAQVGLAKLIGVNFTDAELTGAGMTDTDLTDADLTRADLTEAKLTNANLTRANLTEANLTNANLTRADLTDADLTRADLTRANLSRANLSGARLPADAPVPEGWDRDPAGRIRPAS
jgi:uncharacterized protein YjbI with pentapeptide repeats